MATASELFAAVNEEEEHIVINEDRSIFVPESLRKIAVQYDHNIETVTFDCPRYWDGHDMSKMSVCINYTRSDGYKGMYRCPVVTIDNKDEALIHFTWCISRNVSEAAGALKFIICIKKIEGGSTVQSWHSRLCDTCEVLKGIPCADYVYTTAVAGVAVAGLAVAGSE